MIAASLALLLTTWGGGARAAPEATTTVIDVAAGDLQGNPSGLIEVNGRLYFSGDDRTCSTGSGSIGRELWSVVPGSDPGVVKNINTAISGNCDGVSGTFTGLAAGLGDRLVFAARDAGSTGDELWISDGTEPGTQLLRDIVPGSNHSSPYGHTTVLDGTHVVFGAQQAADGFLPEPWITDGTPAGTRRVADIAPGDEGSFPRQFTPLTDTSFLFIADDIGAPVEHHGALWVSDGTTATLVVDIFPGNGEEVEEIVPFAGRDLVVMAAEDSAGGIEPWVSDGTPAGTLQLMDIRAGSADSFPHSFTQVGDQMYFVANDGVLGSELWVTDGTPAGTRLVKDIRPGSLGGAGGGGVAYQDRLFFQARDGDIFELWVSDGTEAGTVPLRSSVPELTGISPIMLTVVGTNLFFVGNGPTIWITDGTSAGTGPVAADFSDPRELTAVGSQTLAFSARHPDLGREVYLVSLAAPPPLQIALSEGIGVTDETVVLPSVMVGLAEAVAVADAASVRPPVRIGVVEGIAVADTAQVRPPLVISLHEVVTVADSPAVRPPIVISVTESVQVTDVPAIRPPVFIGVTEAVQVADVPVVRPPVVISVTENLAVLDRTLVVPAIRIDVTEVISTTDLPELADATADVGIGEEIATGAEVTITTVDIGQALDANGNPLSRVAGGARILFGGGGFDANSPIGFWLRSDPISLGTGVADAVGAFSAELTIPVVEGGEHVLVATGTSGGHPHEVQVPLTVAMPVSVALDAENPIAIPVEASGGSSSPFFLSFVASVHPELAPHAFVGIEPSLWLEPVGPGSTIQASSCSPDDGNSPLTITCAFDDVPVNTYTATAAIGGLYEGTDADVLVIYDASLGFTTGGGWFAWPGTGDRTTFGFTMQYNRKGTNLRGSLLLIRHLPDGSQYRLKSNALYGLALSDSSAQFGWASFSGKATYQEPGWPDPMGNHEFVVYVEDHGDAGPDRFWLSVKDGGGIPTDLSMPGPAPDEASLVEGGNVSVPHGEKRKGRN